MPGERRRREFFNRPSSTPKVDHHETHSDPEPFDLENAGPVEWQRMVGNQGLQQLIAQRKLPATNGLVQAKLTVGEPGDRFEQQADQVASDVMRMPEPGALEDEQAPEGVQGKWLQRQEDAALEEDEQPEDVQREAMPEDEMLEDEMPDAQMQADEDALEEEDEGTPDVSMQAGEALDSNSAPAVSASVESRIQAARGNGQPLAESSRNFMEPRFGQDFSGVNVHTGSEANALNQELGARAFTTGRDIFFSEGEYNPGSQASDQLLAHELTHVVQQGGGS